MRYSTEEAIKMQEKRKEIFEEQISRARETREVIFGDLKGSIVHWSKEIKKCKKMIYRFKHSPIKPLCLKS